MPPGGAAPEGQHRLGRGVHGLPERNHRLSRRLRADGDPRADRHRARHRRGRGLRHDRRLRPGDEPAGADAPAQMETRGCPVVGRAAARVRRGRPVRCRSPLYRGVRPWRRPDDGDGAGGRRGERRVAAAAQTAGEQGRESDSQTGGGWSNAAWTGTEMIYGDGNGTTEKAFTAANDVIAHEITHGVTSSTANLVYQYQPGALNESFSDVFGYFLDSEDWLIGEDLFNGEGQAIRDMQDPTKYGQPAHMKDYKNYSIRYDNGGVHINSGIPNKAAYNTITKIGKERAEKIYYRALTQYLTRQSQFSDAKSSLMQSAKDLYGDEIANQVKAAWDEVGVK